MRAYIGIVDLGCPRNAPTYYLGAFMQVSKYEIMINNNRIIKLFLTL
jgi:hypothetical protein